MGREEQYPLLPLGGFLSQWPQRLQLRHLLAALLLREIQPLRPGTLTAVSETGTEGGPVRVERTGTSLSDSTSATSRSVTMRAACCDPCNSRFRRSESARSGSFPCHTHVRIDHNQSAPSLTRHCNLPVAILQR